LHASCAVINHRLYAFVGDSGKGKSTLAAYLEQHGCSRVSDDILPVSLDKGQLCAWPRYPQLKIPSNAQYPETNAEKRPLTAVAVLHEHPEQSILAPLGPGKSLLSILGNTVAVRLFNRKLVENHLTFCRDIAEHTGIYQLSYPRTIARLEEVKETLIKKTA